MTERRLIEVAFPLEQVSLDAVHEKNVRHGHISTLHIWPARRPLAASRAALLATLLPDSGNAAERQAIYKRMAGTVVETVQDEVVDGRKLARRKRETQDGILHWKREEGKKGERAPDIDWFRSRIRDAYGGRAPRVLDPFAGGGAIPLEAMRLGCDVTAIDINPVAWFILKCTLDYPWALARETRPLSEFALRDGDFMAAFLKGKGFKGRALQRELQELGLGDGREPAEPRLVDLDPALQADLAWQIRAWGRHVLAAARRRLASRYPTYAEFRPLKPGGKAFRPRKPTLLTPDAQGNTDVNALNAEFDAVHLKDLRKPRWVELPTVAYLWARTARCKGCRATVPLLKTRWLAKKGAKRVLLTVTANEDGNGVVFGVETDVPRGQGNAARRQEHDRRVGAGTMDRSGAKCPLCPATMTMEDLRLDGRAGRLGEVMTAVVVDGPHCKEYRLPTELELKTARVESAELDALYGEIPFGLPDEPTPKAGIGASRAFSIDGYGFDKWWTLFTNRQLLVLGTFAQETRSLPEQMAAWPAPWRTALTVYGACAVSKFADYSSTICSWHNSGEKLRNTFARFALPMVWDYCEVNPLSSKTGGFAASVEWLARVCEHLVTATHAAPEPAVVQASAADPQVAANGHGDFDIICTDPPYYDAIPYSDLMDFFHVWLRRALWGLSPEVDTAFGAPLGPKWNAAANDGELIDDAARFGGDREVSKRNYETGMERAFSRFLGELRSDGRLVIVFANKSPDAWETLVSALIRAGFVVDGSWPIRTEMETRQRSFASAALASSIWIVCRKRTGEQVGWDTKVLAEMRENITRQLRDFWVAGIRGPDFVWAATGPALEAFSKYPVVKKADAAGSQMSVAEFLREVRRFVVDFVVGRVLTHDADPDATNGLDDVTTYYLLHRNDFRMSDAPIGACILYAISCNLSDRDLADRYDILSRTRRGSADEPDGEEDELTSAAGATESSSRGGSKVVLKPWNRRSAKGLGYPASDGRPAPLIDQAHRLMHLWRAGDEAKVNDYLDDRGLKRHALFARLLQALIELADAGSDERAILESLSNHIAARGGVAAARQPGLQRLGEAS